ncbi:hypothetical protein BGZ94_001930, partial [Podila epigama]
DKTASIQRNRKLYTLHERVLCANSYFFELSRGSLIDNMDADEEEEETGQGLDKNVDVAQNHIICTIPYAKHVWEIDSMNPDGPLDLGPFENDDHWSHIALARLSRWFKTAKLTNSTIDIQAITPMKLQ